MDNKYILSAEVTEMKLQRLAYEILEANPGENHIIIAGILDNGFVVATALCEHLKKISSITTELISVSLDKKHPETITINSQQDFSDKVIILVDDVTNSGKTLLYALKPFLEYYPKKIQTLVLVERSHKMYPIHPDFVGLSLATTLMEHIYVEVEGSSLKGAYLK
ncbi:phosphoribosyltransferase family protein [Pollutibacter soli]|uniref:phosphoribosyltransferase family protein n=1 Tax=Pollutibacter soli TaxID=3034157 RepID=UPI003013CAB3